MRTWAEVNNKSILKRSVSAIRPARLIAVIPAFNEELSIGTVVLETNQYVNKTIVVDDGSSDRTAEIAELAGAEVVQLTEHQGMAHALMQGFDYARKMNPFVVITFNGNGLYHLDEIPNIVRPVLDGKADLVIGAPPNGNGKGSPVDKPRDMKVFPAKSGSNGNGNGSGVRSGNGNGNEFFLTSSDPTFLSGICALSRPAVNRLDIHSEDHFEARMVAQFRQAGLAINRVRFTSPNVASRDPVASEMPLYRGKKIAVVVPAYNEELLIGETLKSIPEFVCRVYVVNDASKDRTREITEDLAAQNPTIIPITHEVNQGVGAAIVTGYRKAREDGMDVVAVMAGDNQMDPAFLPDLLDPIIEGKCDYTMGNRLINPEFRKGMSKWRFVGNATLTMLTKIASGYWQMVDPQNGYTAISGRALEQISLDDIYPRYGYCNDILVRMNTMGFRTINVPHPARYGLEKSKIRYSTYIPRVSRLLLKDFIWRLKMKYVVFSFHPLVLFYFFGAILGIAGLLGMIYSLYYKFALGNPFFVRAALSLLVIGIGIQCLFFAMHFDMQQEKSENGWY